MHLGWGSGLGVCRHTFMRPGLKKESTTGDLGNLPKVIMPVSYIFLIY